MFGHHLGRHGIEAILGTGSRLAEYSVDATMLPFTMSFKYEYNSAVRGYQVYKPVWKPEVDQVLHAKRELDNFADKFAEAFSSRRDGRPS